MIGTEMFNEFSRPQLAKASAKLTQSFYHLDGTGQLPHLDSLLQIENLNGVQWVPGDGQPDCSNWPQVYKKINTAGKRIQLLGGFDVLDSVTKQLRTCQGLQLRTIRISSAQIHGAQSKLNAYEVLSNL
jgi:5-methyltetrahydrofolate--homocysteine methyltransferase